MHRAHEPAKNIILAATIASKTTVLMSLTAPSPEMTTSRRPLISDDQTQRRRKNGKALGAPAPNRFERVAFTRLAKNFRKSVAVVQKHVDENVPPVTEQEYLQRHMSGHPNPLFDEHWTLQDEAEIKASWDSTILEQAINRPWLAFPEMRTL
ncbi:hypothetical protein FALBO_13648 [Fusarium albosuccineum]|uniref:Uncharacterized protein n=1 Tax=Fusarium albosuccineum TaxID=1237068 RepID=A0A8H4L151_9HYPO|nr:hypothetical protein FALBO_13648 [Fusarium albosuccineum]